MATLVSRLLILTALLAPAPASAEAEVDTDLAAAIAADRAEQPDAPPSSGTPSTANALNPALSFILDFGLAWFSDEHHIAQGGHAIDQGGFTLQGLELAATASVDPYLRFDLAFQLVGMEIEEAAVSTLSLPLNLLLRAGYLITPFGRENRKHLHQWRFNSPSLAHSRFLSEEHLSGLGAELSMLLPHVPWYSLVLVEVLDPANRKGLGLRSTSFGHVAVRTDPDSGELVVTREDNIDGPEDLLYLARLENSLDLTDDWTLVVGLSGAWGPSPYVPDNRATLYGVDLYVKWRPLSSGDDAMAIGLTVEYFLRDTQVPGDSSRDHGGYLQLEFQVSRHWLCALRVESTDLWHGPSVDDKRMPNWQWRGSLSAAFLPTHFSMIRLQYDTGHQHGLHEPTHALFLQLEIAAGSHGAHTF